MKSLSSDKMGSIFLSANIREKLVEKFLEKSRFLAI